MEHANIPLPYGCDSSGYDPQFHWILSASAKAFQRRCALTPRILAAAEAFPGGSYNAENTLQPSPLTGPHSEYASNGKGVATFIDFDLGQPVRLGGFRHVQRSTIDTIREARLLFSDTPDFYNAAGHGDGEARETTRRHYVRRALRR